MEDHVVKPFVQCQQCQQNVAGQLPAKCDANDLTEVVTKDYIELFASPEGWVV